MHSDRVARPVWTRLGFIPLSFALVGLGQVTPLAAQDDTAQDAVAVQDTMADAVTDSLVGAAVSVGSEQASLELELSDGRTVQLELADGQVRADGETLGRYDEGGQLDRSWRELLEQAAMASTAELPVLLRQWQPPAGSGALGDRLDQRLEQALQGVGGRMGVTTLGASPGSDSIDKLVARIRDLESREDRDRYVAEQRGWDMPRPLEDFLNGLGSLFATFVWFGVFFGIGAALVFFGDGRIERVADTVRTEPLRASLIGLAGAFLAIPFYVLVILALVISILGIPLVIAWAPLFPMLVTLSFIIGWIAVAYSAGDTTVKRKLTGRRFFAQPGNFHSLAVGIALLLTPFALGSLFEMTSVLSWLGELLFVIGVLANVLVSAMGFGAVLIRTRAGLDRHRERRAAEKRALAARAEAEEGSHV